MTSKYDIVTRLSELYTALQELRSAEDFNRFFTDLCTPGELAAMADRWAVARLLYQGVPYRTISEKTGVSTATITRVARAMSYGAGGYRLILADSAKGESNNGGPYEK